MSIFAMAAFVILDETAISLKAVSLVTRAKEVEE